MIDVHSSVTDWPAPAAAAKGQPAGQGSTGGMPGTLPTAGSSGSPTVDRLNLTAQSLATTLKTSLGQPTLVGGLTFGEQASGQLYLVLEINAAAAEAPKPKADSAPAKSKPSKRPPQEAPPK